MKYFLVFMIFLPNLVFAEYNYQNSNNGKIDMHGGKSDSLTKQNKSFSNSGFSLNNMQLQKDLTKEQIKQSKDSKKTQSTTN